MDFGDTSKYRDRESALAAVLRYGYALKDVSTDLRDDEEVVRAAVMNKGYALGYASERLRNDKRTVMIAVNQSWWAIRCASVELRADDDVIAVGIAQSWRAFRAFSLEALRLKRFAAATKLQAIARGRGARNRSQRKHHGRKKNRQEQNSQKKYHHHRERHQRNSEDDNERTDNRETVLSILHEESHADHTMVDQHDDVGSFAASLKAIAAATMIQALERGRQIRKSCRHRRGKRAPRGSFDRKHHRKRGKNGDAKQEAMGNPCIRACRMQALQAVRQHGDVLASAPVELLADRQLIAAAVTRNGDCLRLATPELKADKTFVLDIIAKIVALSRVVARHHHHEDSHARMKRGGQDSTHQPRVLSLVKHLPQSLLADEDVMTAAILGASSIAKGTDGKDQLTRFSEEGAGIFRFASKELRNTSRFALRCIHAGVPGIIEFASEAIRNDLNVARQVFMSINPSDRNTENSEAEASTAKDDNGSSTCNLRGSRVSEYGGELLWCCGPRPRDDEQIVRKAVASNAWALGAASRRLREKLGAERETMYAAVCRYGQALRYASEELQDDADLVQTAVQAFGYALQHASDRLKSNRLIVMTAVQQCGQALQYASDDLKADKEIVLAACAQDNASKEFAATSLRFDRELDIFPTWFSGREGWGEALCHRRLKKTGKQRKTGLSDSSPEVDVSQGKLETLRNMHTPGLRGDGSYVRKGRRPMPTPINDLRRAQYEDAGDDSTITSLASRLENSTIDTTTDNSTIATALYSSSLG